MKKKIIIVSHALEIGGAERSLIGLLGAIDCNMYDVDLFLLRHEGELLSMIPKRINLLPEISQYTVLARPMKQTLKEGHVLLTLARIAGKVKAAYFDKKSHYVESSVALEYSHKFTYRIMPKIQENQEYDLAISFLTPHYIVANKVNAKKKIAWIHTDYSQVEVDVTSELKMWSAYDNIISISESVTKAFLKIFPSIKNKIILIENILSEDMIRIQSNEFNALDDMFQDDSIKFLSIGRYCYQKNFDNIPQICAKLREIGFNIKWYIIGFGGDQKIIEKRIKEAKMEEYVILLGKKKNPYPYIKICDFYIQPSRYEGKAVTVREAQIMHKPVIITDFPTASSQLVDGMDGIIVPMDNVGCAKGIADFVQNDALIHQVIENTYKNNYSNEQEVRKLYQLIEQG